MQMRNRTARKPIFVSGPRPRNERARVAEKITNREEKRAKGECSQQATTPLRGGRRCFRRQSFWFKGSSGKFVNGKDC